MGCALDGGIKKQHYDKSQQNRLGRLGTIDTRKKSQKVVDQIIENIVISKQKLTPKQITFAASCFHKSSLFNSLSNNQLKLIASLLIPASIKEGEYIFHQGDTGNSFFLIQSGQVQVQIDGTTIKTLGQGESFGEIALILRTKRSAGIRAKTDCQFLIMKPMLFKGTMQKIKSTQYQTKRNSIQHVTLFEGLTNKQKLSLANALKIMTYEKGQRIVRKNELANAFYIINEGKVVVELPNRPDIYLTKNQCFGQSAFKIKGRRKGSIIALQRTVCSMISKDDFQKYSGTSADSVYYYSMKNWALQRSQVFKNYSKYILNAINLAFETCEAKANNKIRNDGLVICLQGSINGKKEGQIIFGQQQWKQKTNIFLQLIQEEGGYYAYLNFKKLNSVLINIKQRKQSKNLMSSKLSSNKQNAGFIDIASFDYLKDLGEGQFGAVKLVKDKGLGRLYALKQISKHSIKKQGLEKYILEERKILQKIQFPYIVGFVKAFSDNYNVYFLMEYIKGVELFSVIRQMPALNKQIARYFFASILLAVQHLHQNNIIYRDIKPQNSIVDDKGKVYLIDMGTAKFLRKQQSCRTFTVIGTPHYMAPQIFTAQGYSFQADIWSLGVLLYEFLCNRLPFGQSQEDTYKVMEMIKKQKVVYPKNIQPQSEQILKMLLTKNAQQRLVTATFDKIKRAKFFKGFNWQDMLKQKVFPPYVPKIFKQKGNGLKTINMEGKPLVKQLYPKAYSNGQSIQFKEWNQNISF